MGAKIFDYYIFIDYSENILGYVILNGKKLDKFDDVIKKFKHYREVKNRKSYLKSIKSRFKKEDILSIFDKKKIRGLIDTPEIFSDIAGFLKEQEYADIFISIDNRQYSNFEKFVKIIDGKRVKTVKEGDLKKGSREYFFNLVLDSWLNIERIKNE